MRLYSQAMTDDAGPLKRLAAYVEQRIAALGLEYAEVARLAGFSIEVLRKVRNGVNARGSTYRKLERALRWEQGSVAAILAGGEPTPIEVESAPVPDHDPTQSPMLSSREMEILEDLAALTAEKLGLTAEQAVEALRRARVRIERKRVVGQTGQDEGSDTPRRHVG